MKALIVTTLLVASSIITPLSAEPLSDAQKRALLEELEDLEKQTKSDAQGRYAKAYQACKKAMGSAGGTTDFYINCLEVLDFTDKGKDGKSFRDWKRRNKDRLSEPSLQRALQHQLSWLVLTLEVERSDKPAIEFADQALARLNAIMKDAALIAGNEKILSENATSSVFARCYEVDKLSKESWPDNPLDLDTLFGDLIIPELIDKQEAAKVRKAWGQRIAIETTKASLWGQGKFDKSKDHREKLELQRREFQKDQLPSLVWQREQDVFSSGGESEAIAKMLDIIKSNRGHRDSETWVKEVKARLSVDKIADTSDSSDNLIEEDTSSSDPAFPNLE